MKKKFSDGTNGKTNNKKMENLSISPLNKDELLDFLGRMPPQTSDLHFDVNQQQFWGDLRYRLHCYWLGQADMPAHWTKQYREEIDIHMMIYLNLYNIIFLAWTDIRELANELEIKFPQSAFDYLKQVMFEDWLLSKEKSEMPIPTIASHYRLGVKLKPNKFEKLSKVNKSNLVAELWNRVPKNYEEIQFLKHFCLSIAEDSSSSIVQTELRHYNEACRNRFDFLIKIAHPR